MLSAKGGGGGGAKGKYAWVKTNVDRSKIEIVTNNNPNKYPDDGMLENNYYKKIKEYKVGELWERINPRGERLESFAYGKNIYVAGAEPYAYGQGVFYSIDGINWTKSDIVGGSYSVLYAKNIFLAYSQEERTIYWSNDGKSWTESNVNKDTWNESVDKIKYANGLFVAACSDKGFAYSTDGKTWTDNAASKIRAKNINFANNLWVAAGNVMGESEETLFYSTDGKKWSVGFKTGTSYQDNNFIEYVHDRWLATQLHGSYSFQSFDGKTWEKIQGFANFSTAFYRNKNLYAIALVPATQASTNSILKYDDSQKNWVAVKRFSDIQVNRAKFIGDSVYLTTDRGLKRSNDFNNNFTNWEVLVQQDTEALNECNGILFTSIIEEYNNTMLYSKHTFKVELGG